RESLYGIQLGFHNPKVAKTGFIVGGSVGTAMDERFDVELSLDFYRKSYEETSKIYAGGGGIQPNNEAILLESSVLMLPLMAHARFKVPMSEQFGYPVLPYAQVGFGYIMSWNNYKNFADKIDDSKYFGGFGLRFALGAMYQVGSSSRVSLEAYYMWASLTREEKDAVEGNPVRSELDMSGVGIRLGLHFSMSSSN
ncbi:MAG TPA: hypothetical protein ENH10_09445, partial [Bacteroidetes bacterium]|nr:hypothetical protein [Bacteroidota bacterium]HEX05358.1 hypothetical protein [Bacteroidota bacterium]